MLSPNNFEFTFYNYMLNIGSILKTLKPKRSNTLAKKV